MDHAALMKLTKAELAEPVERLRSANGLATRTPPRGWR